MSETVSLEEIVKMDARTSIQRCFKKWGIERTEDKIKQLMKGQAQRFMLERYRELINGKAQETKT